MLFARWQHHLRFCSGFPYAPLKAMVTKISNSFRITFKIESLVAFAIPDICSKFQKDPSITFRVILLTDRQRDKETNKVWQKHYLLGWGKNTYVMTLVDWVFCVRRACNKQTPDAFQSSRLTGLRLWAGITLCWEIRGRNDRSWNNNYFRQRGNVFALSLIHISEPTRPY